MTYRPSRRDRPMKKRGCIITTGTPYSFVQAVLAAGIVLGLMLSAVFAANAGGKPIRMTAAGTSKLPERIDASGYDAIFDAGVIDPRLILGTELPVIYGMDLEEISAQERIEADLPQTDIFFDVLPDDIKLEILGFANDVPKEFIINEKGPEILIYHTHTQEAYRQVIGKEYVEASAWRTAEIGSSVVAVGARLKKELESHGFSVMHNMTNHEPPKLGTAYTRSLETMKKYERDNASISVFIDVHRDAYGDIAKGSQDYVMINGQPCARIMFVVGTGEAHSQKPNFESNYKLALAVTNQLESIKKGFTRPIRVKTGRYNQHVSDMCLLIEVGHNANSLEQALNATRYIALALSRVLEPKKS